MLLYQSLRCLSQLLEKQDELSRIQIRLLKVLFNLIWLSEVKHLPTSIKIESLHPDHVVVNLLAPGDKDLPCLLDKTSTEQTRDLLFKVHLYHHPYLSLRHILCFLLVLC